MGLTVWPADTLTVKPNGDLVIQFREKAQETTTIRAAHIRWFTRRRARTWCGSPWPCGKPHDPSAGRPAVYAPFRCSRLNFTSRSSSWNLFNCASPRSCSSVGRRSIVCSQ